MVSSIKKYFRFESFNTSFQKETIAGITTFITMAYIIFVNPIILQNAGLPFQATVVTTCLVAGLMTIAMGIFTNYPIALAAGMGFNAFLTFGIVIGMKVSWQIAMGMVVIEGLIITLLVLTNFREAVMDAIPLNLKKAIGAGIGIFIVFIGLKNAGIIVKNDETLVALGNFKEEGVILSVIGIIITAMLLSKKINASLLIGIFLTTILGFFFHSSDGTPITKTPQSFITDLSGNDFSTIGQADILGALQWSFIPVIFALMLTDFFDTMGTVVTIASKGNYFTKEGKIPRLKGILLIDSLAAFAGGFFCASSNTAYIESASGVASGGRTGYTSVIIGILFILAIFFAPLVGIVPVQAVAPALVIVGFSMMSIVMEIDFSNIEEGFAAFLILITIPLTYSISNGIGIGFIVYTALKILNLKFKEVHPLMYVSALMFIIDFIIKSV